MKLRVLFGICLMSLLSSVTYGYSLVLGLNGEAKMTLTQEWSTFSQNDAVCKARVLDNGDSALLQCYQPESPDLVFGIMAQCGQMAGRTRELSITAKNKNVDVLYLKCLGNR